MRVAVVDIGTNSTRLLIAEVEYGRVAAELERETTVTRLGAGVDEHGRLSDEAIERVWATLNGYRRQLDRYRPMSRIAVLTSAVRDATNGAEFAQAVGHRYDLTPFILTGRQEARLTFRGATSEHDPREQTPTLVVDIGGGSTELIIGTAGTARFHVSTQAGVVRQTERHLPDDPPTLTELDELSAAVRGILAAAVPTEHRDGVGRAIAVAGTPTSLAAIAQRLDPYDRDLVHGYCLHRDACESILACLAALPLAARREVPGLHPDRAPTIIAGVTILLEVMSLFGLDRVEASEHDILRGAALDLSQTAAAGS
jgi:exopolyphosphatase/guanosine-5'-triphosphate,3'-diphosphate pyrophosphatase